jgi:predicted nucleotide-binding protein (sugar kinase/HSP70/actin superfamily)
VKLPDRAPDPFRERDALAAEIVAPCLERRGRPLLGLGGEFVLKSFLPFFATFLSRLGFDLLVPAGADQAVLKRGIEEASVPFCAPMQQYHGIVARLAEAGPDLLFVPMIRELPWLGGEEHAKACPIAQGAADILRVHLHGRFTGRVVSPTLEFGAEGFDSPAFRDGCRALAGDLGAGDRFDEAFGAARLAQARFEAGCREIGARALAFAEERGVVPVVVLGRPYTIHNTVLNSNVPAILREQGALAVPVDCYPDVASAPPFATMFWGWGQRILRAADRIRRTPGVYGLYCSNYSCGPDSFLLHFYGYLMDGKPFCVVETDGHSGDAGTKTRIEAFLHCVREDLRGAGPRPPGKDLRRLERSQAGLPDVRARGETLLIPSMGPGPVVAAACLRGYGVRVESLPLPTRESVRLGRRHTSGKECVPMTVTLGSVLERLARARGTDERFALLLPMAHGPCRYGCYGLLHKIVYESLGWDARLRIWSPSDHGYFEGLPTGFSVLFFAGVMAADLLLDCLHDARPVEREPGLAAALYSRFDAELRALLERQAGGDLSTPRALWHAASGRLFGIRALLARAAAAFAAVKTRREMPTVMVVGEIYVRCEPFTNDFVLDRLEQRGLRVKFAPVNEWIEYCEWCARRGGHRRGLPARLSSLLQARTQQVTYRAVARALGWPRRLATEETLAAAAAYLRPELEGEAVLTLGAPLAEWRRGHIDATLSVGPMECMPTKVAEAQLVHAAEREGLPSLTVSVNGDPVDPVILDNFAYEVHSRFRRARAAAGGRGGRGAC